MENHFIEKSEGADFFFERSQMKRCFNQLTKEGFVAFAKECIRQGLVEDDDIIAEACDIGGDHHEANFETLLMEGENIHWLRTSDGQLALLRN